jgi:hypothetical protein
LTGRDVAALVWIAEQYAVPMDLVASVLGRPGPPLSASATRRVLDRLRRIGLIRCQKFLTTAPPYCWITRRGLKHLGLGYTPWEPTIGLLGHMRAVSELRLALESEGEQRQWVSERELRKGVGLNVHVPDAELRDTDGTEVIALEVERSQKGQERLRSIAYKLAGAYPHSWVFAKPGSPAWHSWDRLISELALGGRIRLMAVPVNPQLLSTSGGGTQ